MSHSLLRTANEYWQSPGQLGASLVTEFNETDGGPVDSSGWHTQEMCTNYNALKLFRHLLQWDGDVAIAERYERLLLNGAMGVQKPGRPGVMSYLTPLGNGVTRTRFNWWGWGAPDNAFWCCCEDPDTCPGRSNLPSLNPATVPGCGQPDRSLAPRLSACWRCAWAHSSARLRRSHADGTTIETMAKLGDSIFFVDGSAAAPRLTVAQYIASELAWHAGGSKVTMTAAYREDGSALTANVSFAGLSAGAAAPPPTLRVRLRVPKWAVASRSSVVVSRGAGGHGGAAVAICPGTWLDLTVSSTDTVGIVFGMGPWLDRINDNRTDFASYYSVMWGPLVLSGITERANTLKASPGDIHNWLKVRERPGPVMEAAAAMQTPVVPHDAGAARSIARPSYLWRQGALAAGDDLGTLEGNVSSAEARCNSLGPQCTGFTYRGGRRLSEPTTMLLKSDTAANRSGWDMDKTWSTYLKVEPAPPPVGRVLAFVATGVDGRGFDLLPLNRIVDQNYTIYFNITG